MTAHQLFPCFPFFLGGGGEFEMFICGSACWSWNSNTLATWCEELTHWKRPWCWEILKAGGEGDNREWDGWMASPTQWTWVWASSGSWWWTGKPGVLQSMGLQRLGHEWMTELNWYFLFSIFNIFLIPLIFKSSEVLSILLLIWTYPESVTFFPSPLPL